MDKAKQSQAAFLKFMWALYPRMATIPGLPLCLESHLGMQKDLGEDLGEHLDVFRPLPCSGWSLPPKKKNKLGGASSKTLNSL